jgi:ELWxxDGT repeat protein
MSRRLACALAAVLLALASAPALAAGPGLPATAFSLFADINTTDVTDYYSDVGDTLVIGDTLYFEGMDATYGADMYGGELWQSDGTAAGTMLVKDVGPGSGGAMIGEMTALDGILLFTADDGIHGSELWRSDGTAAGTYMVRDIWEGNLPSAPGGLTLYGGAVYFAAQDADGGRELWRTDGTAEGTTRVADISPGAGSSGPAYLTVFNGVLYFAATTGAWGAELWRMASGGAPSLYEDVWNGVDSGSPHALCACNGTLYFAADNPASGVELWKTTGASSSDASLVENIRPGDADSGPSQLTCAGARLYFAADDGTNGVEPWVSTGGTAATTYLAANVNTTAATGSAPSGFVAWNDAVYFAATGGGGRELYKATPTVTRVANVSPTGDANPDWLTVWNGRLYFTATDGAMGQELWVTDGTTAAGATHLVRDANATATGAGTTAGSDPARLTPFGDHGLYFSAFDGKRRALWATDGTDAGTRLVADLRPGATDAWPMQMAGLHGRLHFTASDGTTSLEPWVSDGTAAGTHLIENVVPDTPAAPGASVPAEYVDYGDYVYLAAGDMANGRELWRSDGTAEHTAMLANINAGAASSGPEYLTVHNSMLYFAATNGTDGYELWRTDGAGILSMVKDVYVGGSSYPRDLASFGGFLYFRATTPGNGSELWRSNGTEGGTSIYRDLVLGTSSSSPSSMTVSAGRLYFAADGGDGAGHELWYTTGNPVDTYRVADVNPGEGSSYPADLVDLDGALYFTAYSPDVGRELWRYTQADGPSLVKDTCPGPASGIRGLSGALFASAGWLWFAANDCVHGTEVWASDGTPGGTAMRADIFAGAPHASPADFAMLYDRLFFRAQDGTHGYELWSADLFAANDDSVITERNHSIVISVLANDAGEPGATIAEFTQPDHGAVVLRDPHASVEFSPEPGYSGPTTFTYTADGYYGSDSATVTVFVDPPDVYLPSVRQH